MFFEVNTVNIIQQSNSLLNLFLMGPFILKNSRKSSHFLVGQNFLVWCQSNVILSCVALTGRPRQSLWSCGTNIPPMDSSDWFIIISVVWAKQRSMHENHIRKGLGTNLLGNRPENLIIIRFVALWGLLPWGLSPYVHCLKFPKTFRPYGVVSRFLTAIGRNFSVFFFYRHIPGHFQCQIESVLKYFGDLFSMRKVCQAVLEPEFSSSGIPRSNHWATQTHIIYSK